MRETLASEMGIDAAGSNDIYDLYLVYNGHNSVQLIIYMKILFTFEPGSEAYEDPVAMMTKVRKVEWKAGEPEKFVSDWRSAIAGAWTQVRYRTYKDVAISIHVSFDTKIGDSYPGSHWQIMVKKLPDSSTGETSFVWRDQMARKYDVQLDSQDFKLKTGMGDGKQSGAIHEFGHMLGLGDEYTSDASAAHQADTKSILNSGSETRPRHYQSVVQWAEKKIDAVKDKIDERNKRIEDQRKRMFDRNMRVPPSSVGYG